MKSTFVCVTLCVFVACAQAAVFCKCFGSIVPLSITRFMSSRQFQQLTGNSINKKKYFKVIEAPAPRLVRSADPQFGHGHGHGHGRHGHGHPHGHGGGYPGEYERYQQGEGYPGQGYPNQGYPGQGYPGQQGGQFYQQPSIGGSSSNAQAQSQNFNQGGLGGASASNANAQTQNFQQGGGGGGASAANANAQSLGGGGGSGIIPGLFLSQLL